ncbi:MAG: hypothetical protein EXR72_18060 [Myxococcales bacterium]|nr:hypothetical protein [Myxococcales bacterium]
MARRARALGFVAVALASACQSEARAPVAQVTTSGSHTCARLTDGKVYCWGEANYGQIGDGRMGKVSYPHRPVKVKGISSAVEIVLGGNYSCARLSDGTVRCWGGWLSCSFGDGRHEERAIGGIAVDAIRTLLTE